MGIHFPPPLEEGFDCPGKNCNRVGKDAFVRKDHMMKHVATHHDGYVNGKKVVFQKKKIARIGKTEETVGKYDGSEDNFAQGIDTWYPLS